MTGEIIALAKYFSVYYLIENQLRYYVQRQYMYVFFLAQV